MNNRKHRLLCDRRLVIVIVILANLFSYNAYSADEESLQIEMELKADPYATYAQKKSDWSSRISIGIENFMPETYISSLDQSTYTSLFGKNNIQLTILNFGGQYNTKIGSLFTEIFYGLGSISNATSQSSMAVTKYGASLGLFLDTMYTDPYVSPYLSGQIFASDWREADLTNGINTGSHIDMMMSYQIGLSMHLDKVDPIASHDAYVEYGLKNSFLDIFAMQILKSQNALDPNFSTSLNWGLNFRLEF